MARLNVEDQLSEAITQLNAAVESPRVLQDSATVAQAVAALRRIEALTETLSQSSIAAAAIPVLKASRTKSLNNEVAPEALIALQMIGYSEPVLAAYIDEISTSTDPDWIQILLNVVDSKTTSDRTVLTRIGINKLADTAVGWVSRTLPIAEDPHGPFSMINHLERLMVLPQILSLTGMQRQEIILSAQDIAYMQPVFTTIPVDTPAAIQFWMTKLQDGLTNLQSKLNQNGYNSKNNWSTIQHVKILSALLLRSLPDDADWSGNRAADWPQPTFIWANVNTFAAPIRDALYSDLVGVLAIEMDITRVTAGQGGTIFEAYTGLMNFAPTIGVRAKPLLPHIAKFFDSPFIGERKYAHHIYDMVNGF